MDGIAERSLTAFGFQPLFSEREAAGLLGIAPATLAKWRSIGEGPAFLKFGRRVLYDAGDLHAYRAAARHVGARGRQGQDPR
jgi:hypothetical protein